jgi:chromosome partitioning protein
MPQTIQHQMVHKPYIISVCHQKGGVGKTTTVSSLGASLADIDYQVLLVDLDPSANLTTGLGLTANKKTKSAADILLGNDTLLNIFQQTSLNGLSVIPSSQDMLTASRFLYLRKNYEYLLKDMFNREGQQFDIILIDCPPSLGMLTICALTASHMAIIPLQCEYYPLQALHAVLKTIINLRKKINPQLTYQLLITMYDKRGKFHARVYEQIKEHFANSMFNTIIGFDTKLRESQLFEIPIITHAKNTRATKQYRQLAKELIELINSQ